MKFFSLITAAVLCFSTISITHAAQRDTSTDPKVLISSDVTYAIDGHFSQNAKQNCQVETKIIPYTLKYAPSARVQLTSVSKEETAQSDAVISVTITNMAAGIGSMNGISSDMEVLVTYDQWGTRLASTSLSCGAKAHWGIGTMIHGHACSRFNVCANKLGKRLARWAHTMAIVASPPTPIAQVASTSVSQLSTKDSSELAPWLFEPRTFLAVKLGSPLSLLSACPNWKSKDAPPQIDLNTTQRRGTLCVDINNSSILTLHNTAEFGFTYQATIILDNTNQSLATANVAGVLMKFTHDNFKVMEAALIQKYGEPTQRTTTPHTNVLGATVSGETLSWVGYSLALSLEENVDSANESAALIITKGHTKDKSMQTKTIANGL